MNFYSYRSFSQLRTQLENFLFGPNAKAWSSSCTSPRVVDKISGKILSSPQNIIKNIQDGATILVGGFGLSGIPETLIASIKDQGTKNLIVASNNAG